MHLESGYISLLIFLAFAFVLLGILTIFSHQIMNFLDYLADREYQVQNPLSPNEVEEKLKENE